MFSTLDPYLKRLKVGSFNLLILKDGGTLFSSKEEGMRPLYLAITRLGLGRLEGSVVVDKIVGKAAALLICYFKAKQVHCSILSLEGKELLEKYGVKHNWESLSTEIINRSGTDICPFERAVTDIDDPTEGYKRVYTKLKSLKLL